MHIQIYFDAFPNMYASLPARARAHTHADTPIQTHTHTPHADTHTIPQTLAHTIHT